MAVPRDAATTTRCASGRASSRPCGRWRPVSAPAAEGALRSPGVSLGEVVVPLLVNELSELPGRVVLVLDDLHAVADEHIHRSLVAFVERLPATVHLAVATRADPPLAAPAAPARPRPARRAPQRPDALQRGRGAARTSRRSASSSRPSGSRRSSGAPRAGPPACSSPGLSLREHPAGERLGAALAGDNRHIGDYLAAEVLDGVTPEERGFLVRTSILDRMSGAAVRRGDRRQMGPAPGSPSSIVATCSSSRSTATGSGIATTRCSPISCARGWRSRSPEQRPSCTRARPRGSPARGRPPTPSGTPSPPATNGRRPSSSPPTG